MRYIRIIGAKSFMELTHANVADWHLYGTTFLEWKEETGKDYDSWVSERVSPALDLFDYIAWYEDGSLQGYEGGYSVILDPGFGLWTNSRYSPALNDWGYAWRTRRRLTQDAGLGKFRSVTE